MELHTYPTWDQTPEDMIHNQLIFRGIRDENVLQAFRNVDRKNFVPETHQHEAYADTPLDIGDGQTISQPYIVAYMLQALHLEPHHRILEIGTGSLYNAALLAELVDEVYTLEVKPELYQRALRLKKERGLNKILLKFGDGYRGWHDHAPYDGIILTAAPPSAIPEPLVEQLREGGRMVAPVGKSKQTLNLLIKTNGRMTSRPLLDVRFVPMVKELTR